MYGENIWSISSNLVGILPCVYYFTNGWFIDGVYTLLVLLSSICFHWSVNTPYLPGHDILDYQSIRLVDLFMAETFLLMVPTWIIWRDNYSRRFLILICHLPLQIYSLLSENHMREWLCGGELLILFGWILYRVRLKSKWFLLGSFICILDLLNYSILEQKYPEHSNLYHGFHHLFGLLAVWSFQHMPPISSRLVFSLD